jgi:hypothetical protein
MTRPAIEVADIIRRRGSQFIERFKAVLNYQQLKAYRVRSTLLLQLMPIQMLSEVSGAGSQAMAPDPATRSAQHQLLPCCLHPAPRTEPAGTDFTHATA